MDRVHPGGGRLWGVLLLCRMADQEVSVGTAKGPDGGLYGDKGSPPQVLAQLLRQSQNRRRGEAAELWVPWMLGKEIESETPLLLVREDEESEPRVYPARSSRGI